VNFGALGAGSFASGVAYPILSKTGGVELIGVASANGLRAADAAKKFGFHYATSRAERIFEDDDINTVAILTRHRLHAVQTTQALEAGKHVYCEKPLALNSEELERIFSALGSSGRVLTVGFNRRFAPLAIKLKEFLDKTSAPQTLHFRINAGRLPSDHWLHDPAEGGGRIIGEVCHFVDFLLFLTDAGPIEVLARGLPDVDPYREDNISISLKFSDGSIGVVDYIACGDPSVEKEYLEVFTGGRSAKLIDFRRLELSASGKTNTIRSNLRQDKGHGGIWQAFINSLQAGAAPPIPYWQIRATHQTTFAALASLRSGENKTLTPPDSEGAEILEG
jgi:predicted dehydrogenase